MPLRAEAALELGLFFLSLFHLLCRASPPAAAPAPAPAPLTDSAAAPASPAELDEENSGRCDICGGGASSPSNRMLACGGTRHDSAVTRSQGDGTFVFRHMKCCNPELEAYDCEWKCAQCAEPM